MRETVDRTTRPPARREGRAVLASILLLSLVVGATGAGAAEVKFFRIESRDAFLAGSLEDVSVDPLGRLRLADAVERVSDIEEPFLFSGAATPTGWVFGTGNAGRVLGVDREGTVATLFEAPEPEIFALWADDDGTVFAGTSPNGKVYRIAGGEATEFFDPEATYIWQIARAADGDLLVATGTEGKVYKVDSRGHGELFYDSEDTHVRALEPLSSGRVLLGTAGNGLILSLDAKGRARTLHDSTQSEVVAFATAPNGDSYAAVLSSEASLANLNQRGSSGDGEKSEAKEEEDEGSVSVKTESDGGAPAYTGSRPQGFGGPRTELLRIRPSGAVDTIGRFEEETVYDLLWSRGQLWIATGLEGRLYSLQGDDIILESSVDERQIVALVEDERGPAFATTNAAALFRFEGRATRQGTYTSATLDAGQISRFGSLRWRGQEKGKLRFSFRSGMSAEPDVTWSDWSSPKQGRQVRLGDIPEARYLQWRAELEARTEDDLEFGHVEISYRQVNLAPRIDSISVLAPGEILVPQNFNPGNQTFEVTNKSRGGIFTTLGRVKLPSEKRGKTLWKQGYRTLRWEGQDANEDELTYTLGFRPENTERWLPMAEDLKINFYSFDTTVLPDGFYRFRVGVDDAKSNRAGEELDAHEISELVAVDNTAPTLARRAREGGGLKVTVEDAMSPLRTAEYSLDAEAWTEAIPDDGILDGTTETFGLDVPDAGGLLLLRVVDSAHNVTTFDLSRGGG